MKRRFIAFILGAAVIALAVGALRSAIFRAEAASSQGAPRFEVSFPASVHEGTITGRVFVMFSERPDSEPRFQVGNWGDAPPFFGIDVNELKPGETAVIGPEVLGYPVKSLNDIPAGDYYVQALLNVYTPFPRADGKVIWAHMDQWEGQRFSRSPGNLYSGVKKVHFDPSQGGTVSLTLDKAIPSINEPKDTPWVKHIKIQSELLTRFWGHPMYLGAVVLLPKDYDTHPNIRYPVIYYQGHFGLNPPFGFTAESRGTSGGMQGRPNIYNRESRFEFSQAWMGENFPRMIAVTFQHPTPYFDDSYAVNSANDGPYGDALLTELIPYLEAHFRMIPEGYARILVGGSTGGWESLALQVMHPEFFGGTWTLYPDPVDFSRYQLVDIYRDDNAFFEPGHQWMQISRPMMRTTEGQVEVTVQQMSQLEEVLGSHGRSCQQFEGWEAVYGPVGDDGYPKPLWDKQTGKIDHEVADYMRDHGYDLDYYLQKHWDSIGPKLVGKIHVDVGDMDNYYLNLAVYKLEDFLKATTHPSYGGSFLYGRPMKGHGWQHTTSANMIREMAAQVLKNTPGGGNKAPWEY